MIKNFILLLILWPIWSIGQKTAISFDHLSHNFKNVPERGGKIFHEFKFQNTGKYPLIIKNVRSGCGCIALEWENKPILPGKEGSIKVGFDPENRPGLFVRSIIVNTNTKENTYNLTIRGNVIRQAPGPFDRYRIGERELKTTKNFIHTGRILKPRKSSHELPIANTGNSTLKPEYKTNAGHLEIKFSPEEIQAGEKGRMIVNILSDRTENWGDFRDSVAVLQNGTIAFQLQIEGYFEEDFSNYGGDFSKAPAAEIEEAEFDLGDLQKGECKSGNIIIRNIGKSKLFIREIENTNPGLEIKYDKKSIARGRKTKISFKFDSSGFPHDSNLSMPVKIRLNDPQNPVIEIIIKAGISN